MKFKVLKYPLTHDMLTVVVILFLSVLLCQGNVEATNSGIHKAVENRERKIPHITFKNLSPPFLDYEYFKGNEGHPFQTNADSFNLTNAWWLAETSTLVYAEDDFIRAKFRMAGLPNVRFFVKRSTFCSVAYNAEFAVVVFRGSEIWKKRENFDLKEVMWDLKTDLDIWPTAWAQGGKVHRGFKEALDEVWEELLPFIRKLDNGSRTIWITGHSLGGALATLCASRYPSAQGTYTFGSPRVGNKDFKRHLDAKIYRVVNNADIVPRLPSLGLYEHVGELEFMGEDGDSQSDPVDGKPFGLLKDGPRNEAERAGMSGESTSTTSVPGIVRDHVPLLYAVKLWNRMVRAQ